MPRPRNIEAREETANEIKAIARQQLADNGTNGISLRGIARDLGITAPAIYNYFPKLEDLITALLVDAFTGHADAVDAAFRALEKSQKELAEANKILEKLSSLDGLTGVPNRRRFDEVLKQEWQRAIRHSTAISLIMLDIDFFKQFNDTYGHRCGDFVLQYIANFLNERIRRGDVLCRYGGEEFVIFMPNAPIEVAYQRSETLRNEIANTFLEYEDLHLKTSFSAGVAGFPMHGGTSDAILNAADKALYQAKNSGRNRVVIYESPEPQKDEV